MKIKDVESWLEALNYVSSVVEELANPANEEDIRALDKLDYVIDELYNLEKKLKKQNQRRAESVKRWSDAIDAYVQAKKDAEEK